MLRTGMMGAGWKTISGGWTRWASVAAVVMGAGWPVISRANHITWTGAVSSDFENPDNWAGGVAPTNDTTSDYAVFDGAAAHQPALTTSRQIGGLIFKTSGWTLGGAGYTLTKGSLITYAIELDATSGSVEIDPNVTTSSWSGVKIPGGATLIFNGIVTTPTGNGMASYDNGGVKSTGTVQFNGSQSNSIGQIYDSGSPVTWVMNKSGGMTVTPSAHIGTGQTFRWLQDNQITAGAQGLFSGGSGTYDLNGHNQTFSQFIVPDNGKAKTLATVTTGAGTATLSYSTPLQVSRTDLGAAMSISGNVLFTNSAARIDVKHTAGLAYDLDLQAKITGISAGTLVVGYTSGYNGVTRFGSATGNSYSAATTVDHGATLLVSNASGSATGSGNVTVQHGAMLGGNGTIAPAAGKGVDIESSGILAPSGADGTGLGTLTVAGDVTLEAGGALQLALGNAGASSLLQLSNLTLSGDLNLSQLDGTSASGNYTLVAYSGALSGTFASISGVPAGYSLDYGTGSDSRILLVSSVPEPASLGLICLGGLLMAGRRRRR